MSKQSYFHTFKRIGTALFVTMYALPMAAQYEQDTLLLKFLGSEEAIKEWKKTQKDAYSFDHLLQKPAVAKHYKNKRFGDHLFLEGGMQAFTNVTRPHNGKGCFDGFAPWAYVGIGDWVTPLHGWRLSMQAGNYVNNNRYSKVLGGSLDYLLNLNAVASEKYDKPKPFEVYGVAGADFFRSENKKSVDYAFGFHLGLRGQYHFNHYSYIFLEPRIGLYTDELIHQPSWRKYIIGANALAGVGYRLDPVNRSHEKYHTSGHFLDNTFISVAAGPTDLLNIGNRYGVSKKFGATAQGMVGKWFSPYSAIRLKVGASFNNQYRYGKLKALNLGAGYMWNMHNTFAGYNPDRCFWVNTVADVLYNYSGSGNGRKSSFGFGAGIQPNVRLAKGVELFLEPRVDVYGKNYAASVGEMNRFDFIGSVLAGLTFRQGMNSREQIMRNDDFEQKSWYDHIFIEAGAGIVCPVTTWVGKEVFKHLGPDLNIGVGKWFNATSGVRLWGEIGRYEEINTKHFDVIGIGADYLWNLTNALHGYVADRPCEVIASAGINTVANMDRKKFYFGGQVGLKGLWHLNNMLGLYLEPQFRIYDNNLMARSSFVSNKIDINAMLLAGIQLRMNGYRPGAYSEAFDENERNAFFSFAGGISSNLDAPKATEQYAVAARFSYGQWFTPASAWRINAGAMGRPNEAYRHALVNVGGDYMTDLTTLAYGYNPDRIVSVRSVLGLNLGAEYKNNTDGKVHFVGDVHAGGQLAFRAGSRNEIFVEPQLSYTFGNLTDLSKMERINATAYIGVTHKIHRTNEKKVVPVSEKENDFVSVSIGSGLNTHSLVNTYPRKRCLNLNFGADYGHWFNSVSGFRMGLAHSSIYRNVGKRNLHLTTIHADYMVNLLALCGGELALEQPWTLNAFAGLSFNIGQDKAFSPTFAAGGLFGLQVGYKFTRQWELFAETSGNIVSNKVWRNAGHKFEGNGSLMLGTKYYF